MCKRVSLIWNMCQIADSLSSGKRSHAEAMHKTMKQIHSDKQELGKQMLSVITALVDLRKKELDLVAANESSIVNKSSAI